MQAGFAKPRAAWVERSGVAKPQAALGLAAGRLTGGWFSTMIYGSRLWEVAWYEGTLDYISA